MNFLSNILTWLNLPGPLRIKLFAYIIYKNWHKRISLQGKKCKKFNFFQNQNDTCAHLTSSLFTLVMKFHDRQSSERCIRMLISRHCFEKTRTRWNDFLFLITDDRDFRPQTCTNGLVFRGYKHIKNIFEVVYFTKNSFHITYAGSHWHTYMNMGKKKKKIHILF
jgi:hypothetical protein